MTVALVGLAIFLSPTVAAEKYGSYPPNGFVDCAPSISVLPVSCTGTDVHSDRTCVGEFVDNNGGVIYVVVCQNNQDPGEVVACVGSQDSDRYKETCVGVWDDELVIGTETGEKVCEDGVCHWEPRGDRRIDTTPIIVGPP